MLTLLNYKWLQEKATARRDNEDRTIYYSDFLRRSLNLRDEVIGTNKLYLVTFSAQRVSGRHSREVNKKSFTSYSIAKEYLLELADKHYAPQSIIEKIKEDMKKV